jgi:predicted transcriptional regulator of viral defense system
MGEAQNTYNYLEGFINTIRAKGRHSFALEEVRSEFDISDKALNQNLYRLKQKKRIAQIRNGFYAIISPEYSSQGMIPLSLFINDLMETLNRKYYVGLFSAAALYGAAHQQPMESFIIIEKPALYDIKNAKVKINFLVKKDWSNEDVIQRKTDAGYMNVSSPELTSLDLFYYLSNVGISNATTVMQELIEAIRPAKFARTVKKYPQTTTLQRLGYILDVELNNKMLSDIVYKFLAERRHFTIPLVPGIKEEGDTNPKWKIIHNVTIEGDL